MRLHPVKVFFVCLLAVVCLAVTANAKDKGEKSGVAHVRLSATMPESLTVVPSDHRVNFQMQRGAAADADSTLSLQTSWNLQPSTTGGVELVGYFDSAQDALAGSEGGQIPSGRVLASLNRNSFRAFDQSAPALPPGGSLSFFREALGLSNARSTRRDELQLRIDLSTFTELPAGQYDGVLHIQARVF